MVRQELPLRYGYSVTCTRFTLTYADLTSATTGPQSITLQDVLGNLFQVAQGGLVLGLRVKLDTVFAGGSGTALSFTIGQVGDVTNNTFFMSTPFNCLQAVGDNVGIAEVLSFKAGQDAAFNINATFSGDGSHNLNTFTSGQVHIDVFIIQFGPINTQLYPTSVTP